MKVEWPELPAPGSWVHAWHPDGTPIMHGMPLLVCLDPAKGLLEFAGDHPPLQWAPGDTWSYTDAPK